MTTSEATPTPESADRPTDESAAPTPDAEVQPAPDAPSAPEPTAEPVADATAPKAEAEPGPDTEAKPATAEPATEATAASTTEAPAAAESAPVPAPPTEPAGASEPVPTPKPAVPTPGPRPMPAPPASRLTPVVSSSADEAWGRVDDDGTVSVRDGGDWRAVGQYPDGTPEEALAYFTRKFNDLALKVGTLEQRHHAGGASAADLQSQAGKVRSEVEGAAAVGDLASLLARIDTLTSSLATASAEEAAAAREAVDAAIAQRTELVERAEALAAKDPKSTQWKQTTTELNDLFASWQASQQSGPRLPKSASQALWRRFRDARSIVERHRRAFYAELDEVHKAARDRKTRLVERAEALTPKGEDGIPSYRDLLEEWKAAGRAGRKVDDALWARFKAAGDVLYGARAERDATEQADSQPRIVEREGLLEEAKAVADEADLSRARALLTGIQRRWEDVGRIFPRDKERALDERLRKIEQALRAREDVDWKRNNPETKARTDGVSRQLLDAIEKLESELGAAQAAGDDKAVAEAQEALDARRSWLKAIGG